MKIGPLARLGALLADRAQLVEQLQAIDDEAAELVQGLQAQAQEAAAAWPHVVPKPPPATRGPAPGIDCCPGQLVGDHYQGCPNGKYAAVTTRVPLQPDPEIINWEGRSGG